MRLKKAVARLIELERVCRVATVSPRGVPRAVPVCHVLLDGKIYFASERGARKVRNLEANPHATVTVDLYSEAWSNLKGVMIQGSTALIRRSPRFRKLRDALYEKYPQYEESSPIGASDSVIVEVTPKRVLAWGMD
jgi:nitroimidazol reductase NimA-like FMN-containing flavoprotein (pyridoxamine 5'-phosphate oxidase superfamily)